MTYLNSGIFMAPFHPLSENPVLDLERDMELLQHLDALNYTEAWIGEHHSGGFEIIGSPEVFIAAAATFAAVEASPMFPSTSTSLSAGVNWDSVILRELATTL